MLTRSKMIPKTICYYYLVLTKRTTLLLQSFFIFKYKNQLFGSKNVIKVVIPLNFFKNRISILASFISLSIFNYFDIIYVTTWAFKPYFDCSFWSITSNNIVIVNIKQLWYISTDSTYSLIHHYRYYYILSAYITRDHINIYYQ